MWRRGAAGWGLGTGDPEVSLNDQENRSNGWRVWKQWETGESPPKLWGPAQTDFRDLVSRTQNDMAVSQAA